MASVFAAGGNTSKGRAASTAGAGAARSRTQDSSKKSRSNSALKTSSTSPRPEPTMIKRRNSSFANSSSPWFRRNSFLSPTMIQDENFNVYESHHGLYTSTASGGDSLYISNYSIISLRECQGFLFNQDLFATPYQQVRSQANEKRMKANSRRNSSRGISLESKRCGGGSGAGRRHTSYHPQRPQFGTGLPTADNDKALVDGDEDEDEDQDEDEEMHDASEDLSHNNRRISDFSEDAMEEEVEEEEEEEDDEDEDDEDDDEDDDDDDDYREMHAYGGDFNNRRYKVKVTDIVIDETDADIFPNSEM
ncbi:uncharacterized protein LODBEIA_P19650 [Lodderomyces beijingensis]|uniref:Transcription factor Iwr1 domain-containing protein n=1 Tax=Lodderomyces beijingensis TaxID=1775926 RepID=A0ABP0ZLH0_9ASCO